ncbi:MAG: YkvA family protein [Gammaproteobacteria bacterium]|nr:YkvA family protein [Gammaproteobacteria bacterium]
MSISVLAKDYSERGFWRKLVDFGRTAGREVIEKALWLFYAAERPETPKWAKATVYGALAYFVLPADAVPDITPLAGYSDDLTVLAAALATVSRFVDAEVKAQTNRTLARWFGTSR